MKIDIKFPRPIVALTWFKKTPTSKPLQYFGTFVASEFVSTHLGN